MKKIGPKTGKLFGDLWKNLSVAQIDDSVNLIRARLKLNKFNENKFKNKNVLDVGCGSGRFCILASGLKAKKVIGVDISKQNINLNNKKYKKLKNLKFKYGDNLQLNFKKNSFDITISQGVIHHTIDMFKSLDELIRVTKKGGIILILIYGDHGMRWSLIKKLRPISLMIGKDKIIKYMRQKNFPENNIKHFIDDLFVSVQTQTSLEHIKEYLKNRISKIKVWSKSKTYDHEENLMSYLVEFYALKSIFNCLENKFLNKLSINIINSYINEIKSIKKSNLSYKQKRQLIIGEGNHRLEIIK